jgi:antirestriction protein ArdC
MARRRRQLTDDERAERRARERELMESAVRSLLTSEGWQQWVRVRAMFRQYSPANTWLIALQAPHATRVAGFRAWLKLNRCVRKGERGIRIWAPMQVQVRDGDGNVKRDEETGQELRRLRFRLTSVFDVSQTEPLPNTEPVPLAPPSAPVTGGTHAALLPRLIAFAEGLGIPVSYEQLPDNVGGYFHTVDKRIALADGRAANATVRVLIHELSHMLVDRLDAEEYPYAREEVIAETVTYLVCTAAGVDVSGSSIPYVASWGESGALEAVQQNAEVIDAMARQLEGVIDPVAAGTSEAVAA